MHITPSILLLSAVATAGAPALPAVSQAAAIEHGERDALRQLESPGLAGLRAAGAPMTAPLDDLDRDVLRSLQSQQLEQQRAGDLRISNNDLSTVLLVLAIVVLVAIIV